MNSCDWGIGYFIPDKGKFHMNQSNKIINDPQDPKWPPGGPKMAKGVWKVV